MRHVSIEDRGRCGTVTYHEAGHRLACYWEFGGGDVVAIVQCGAADDWARHPWALGRRADILQYIADEVVCQKAPGCLAEIDQNTGVILLRQAVASSAAGLSRKSKDSRPVAPGAVTSTQRAAEARWVFRLTTLRARLGLMVLAASLLVGAGLWVKDALFTIDPGKGTAIGHSVRTDRHIATLIQSLEPYVPSLDRNHGDDTYSISLLLVPLDGSSAQLIPLRRGLSPGAFSLAKVLGSDGRTLWFDVAGIGGVDLGTSKLRSDAEIAAVDPRGLPRPWGDSPLAPTPEQFLAAGLMISPTTWLGLHADAEVARDFRPGQWLKPVVRAESARQARRFHLGEVEPASTTGHSRIVSMRAVGESEYLDAAFLRASNDSTPFRLEDPPGALVLYSSARGLEGTAVVARVDDDGDLLWSVDTGISRSALQQILPGTDATAFVGTRPPVPNEVSEPLLVIVEHDDGRQATHSLWR